MLTGTSFTTRYAQAEEIPEEMTVINIHRIAHHKVNTKLLNKVNKILDATLMTTV